MKRVLFVALVAVLVLSMSAMAAEGGKKMPMAFGFKAGIAMGTLTGDSLKNAFTGADKKSRFGIGGGAFFAFTPTKNFTIQPELLYVQKGVKFEDPTGSGKVTLKVDYLEIPVLLKFTPELQNSKITPAIFAGPYLGFTMSGKEKGDGFTDPADNYEVDVKDSLKSTDFGVTFGGGFGYKLTKGEIFFDVRYDLGLSKVVKKEAFGNADFDTKASTFMAFIGYKFDI